MGELYLVLDVLPLYLRRGACMCWWRYTYCGGCHERVGVWPLAYPFALPASILAWVSLFDCCLPATHQGADNATDRPLLLYIVMVTTMLC